MVPWIVQKGKYILAAAFLLALACMLRSDTGRVDLHPRVGLGISTAADAGYWAGVLGAGWYVNWRAGPVNYRQPEYWQMVRLSPGDLPGQGRPPAAEVAHLAARWQGGVWIIGNEPDNIWQDNITAEEYAHHYYAYYTAIKQADPGAQVAVAGVSQGTPLRLAYLDRVLAEYERRYGGQMPVDWWTLHGYALREERGSWGVDIPPGFVEDTGLLIEPNQHGDLDLFDEGIRAFRAWMAARGYRDRPLALTEFGILLPGNFGYTPEVVSQYLVASFRYLQAARDPGTGYPEDDGLLVQRWAWFSLSDPIFPVADLADLESGRLTPIGQAFRRVVQQNQPYR